MAFQVRLSGSFSTSGTSIDALSVGVVKTPLERHTVKLAAAVDSNNKRRTSALLKVIKSELKTGAPITKPTRTKLSRDAEVIIAKMQDVDKAGFAQQIRRLRSIQKNHGMGRVALRKVQRPKADAGRTFAKPSSNARKPHRTAQQAVHDANLPTSLKTVWRTRAAPESNKKEQKYKNTRG